MCVLFKDDLLENNLQSLGKCLLDDKYNGIDKNDKIFHNIN